MGIFGSSPPSARAGHLVEWVADDTRQLATVGEESRLGMNA
jgi:hypothetical protein